MLKVEKNRTSEKLETNFTSLHVRCMIDMHITLTFRAI